MVDELVWPVVREEFGRLRARPGLIAAGLAVLGIGIGGGVAARRARRRPRSKLPWRR